MTTDILPTNQAQHEELRLCSKCRQPFPLSHYRRRKSGSEARHSDCRRCHATRVREWYETKKNSDKQKAINSLASSLTRAQSDDQIRRLMDDIIGRFGGTDQLAHAWVTLIKRAMNRPGVRVLKSFEAIVLLIQHSENHPEDFNHMSLEDIHSEKLKMAKEAILENPAIALYAAQQLGWTVIPPTETPQDAHS